MPEDKEKKNERKLKIKSPKVGMPKVSGKRGWRGFAIYAILGIILFGFLSVTATPPEKFLNQEPISKVISDIKNKKVQSVEIDGDRITVKPKKGEIYASRKEDNQSLFIALQAANVDPISANIEVKDHSFSQAWVGILTTLLPIGLMVVFFFFIFRQAREGAASVFSFGRSRAKQFTRDMPKTTFKDVAGVDEAKQELEEVVDFLKHPEKYKALG